jgi:ammonia channel protein AmtB
MYIYWLVLGGILSIAQYCGLSLCSLAIMSEKEKRAGNSLSGVWITSKLFDLSIEFVMYILISWAFAFGKDDGNMFVGTSQYFAQNVTTEGGLSTIFFTFTVTTISMLIVAEKVKHQLTPLHLPYHLFIIISGSILCPIVMHWLWSDSGWASPWRSYDQRALLNGCGVLDTGGSSSIHLTAALIALGFTTAVTHINFNRFNSYGDGDMEQLQSEGDPETGNSAGTSSCSLETIENKSKAIDNVRQRIIGDSLIKNVHSNNSSSSSSSTHHTSNRVRLIHEQHRRHITKEQKNNSIKSTFGLAFVWIGTYGSCIVCNMPYNDDELTTGMNEISIGNRVLNVTLAAAFACITSVMLNKIDLFTITDLENSDDNDDDDNNNDDGNNENNANKVNSNASEKALETVRAHSKTNIKFLKRKEKENFQNSTHVSSVITALAAIKAGCAVLQPEGACIVGIISPILHRLFWNFQANYFIKNNSHILNKKNEMDIISTGREGAFHTHLAGGLWGMISTGLFASPDLYKSAISDIRNAKIPAATTDVNGITTAVFQLNDRSTECSGIFYGGDGSTLYANITFILALLLWCFALMFIVTNILIYLYPFEFKVIRKIATKLRIMSISGSYGSIDTSMNKNNDSDDDDDDDDADADVLDIGMELENLTDHEIITRMEMEEVLVENELHNITSSNKDKNKNKNDMNVSFSSSTGTRVEAGADSKKGMYASLKRALTRKEQKLSPRNSNKTDSNLIDPTNPEFTNENNKSFEEQFGYSWDAIMVFPLHQNILTIDAKLKYEKYVKNKHSLLLGLVDKVIDIDAKSEINDNDIEYEPPLLCDSSMPSAKDIINILRDAGCETYQYYSFKNKMIICKIRVPLLVLRRYADMEHKTFLLDEKILRIKCNQGFSGKRADGKYVTIEPFDIYDGFQEGVTSLRPYQYIYGKASTDMEPNIYKKATKWEKEISSIDKDDVPVNSWVAKEMSHEFGSLQRLSIINDLVRNAIDEYAQYSDTMETSMRDLFETPYQDDSNPNDNDNNNNNRNNNYNNLSGMNTSPAILSFFPLHNNTELEYLSETVFSLNILPGQEPPNGIRDYFGEEIALYFKFLAHYIKFLIPIAFLGFLTTIYMIYKWSKGTSYYEVLNYNSVSGLFGICTCIWTHAMLKFWDDRETLYALRWGTTEYEETERELPNYTGAEKSSYIDGKKGFKVVDIKQQLTRKRLSGLVMSTLALAVVCVFAATFLMKFWMITHAMTNTAFVADIINAITIFALDYIYSWAAIKATTYENCRTQTEFNDSLITKLFVAGFFNTYAPTIYIAFFKKLIGDPCLQDSCMGELGQTLTVVFCAKSFASHFINFIVPKMTMLLFGSDPTDPTGPTGPTGPNSTNDKDNVNVDDVNDDVAKQRKDKKKLSDKPLPFRKSKTDGTCIQNSSTSSSSSSSSSSSINEQIKISNVISNIELEFQRPAYPDVFTDYNEISIQFGFISLFVTAFPVAPILAMVLNFIEDRVDGWKLINNMKRPWPRPSEDIGSWYDIFNLVSLIGIFFNAGIVSYTMDLFDTKTAEYRLGVFFTFSLLCFIGRHLFISYFDLKLTNEANIQIKRQEHLNKKIIERESDNINYDNNNLKYLTDSCLNYYMNNDQHKMYSNSDVFNVYSSDGDGDGALEDNGKDK